MDDRTEKQLAREAYQVQDACNLAGVLHGAHRTCVRLRQIAEERGESWDWVDRHPVMMLWADKIASLTGTQSLNEDVQNAYNKVFTLIAA